jgi:hypothetical protein
VVLLLLAGLWIGAGIYYWRSRWEGLAADSIGSFHYQLRALERAVPVVIHPANRLGGPLRRPEAPGPVDLGVVAVDATVGAAGATLVARPVRRPLASTPMVVASRRRRAFKRRRDVFFGLMLGLVGSFSVGLVPSLRMMWVVSGVLLVLLVAYTAALVNLRNRAAERSMKDSFRARRPEPAVLLVHGQAN